MAALTMSAIGDALARIVVMQAALVTNSQAFDVAGYEQATLPYWTNNRALASVERISAAMRTLVFNVTMTLHRGMVGTEGYRVELEEALQDEMENAVVYFEERPFLQTVAQPDRLASIAGRGCSILRADIRAQKHLNAVIVLEVPIVKAINPQ